MLLHYHDAINKGCIKSSFDDCHERIFQLLRRFVVWHSEGIYYYFPLHFLAHHHKVTLRGTIDDWKEIRSRVDKLHDFNDNTLSAW
jgi:hypothetical protein